MKKTFYLSKIFIFFTAFLSLFFLSCNEKKQETVTKEEQKEDQVVKIQKKEPTIFYKNSTFIQSGLFLYEEIEDNILRATKQVNIGDKIQVIFLDGKRIEKSANVKLSNDEYLKDDLTFIKVRLLSDDGSKEYWTRDTFISKEGTSSPILAVMKENANIYTDDNLDSVTDEILKKGTLVTFYEDCDSMLNKLCIYDKNSYGKIVYVQNYISTSQNLINYYDLKNKLKNADINNDIQEELEEILKELIDAYKEEEEIFKKAHSGK